MEILLSVRALARFDFLGRRKSNIGIAKLHNIIFLKKFISIIRLRLKLETGIKLLPILETAADFADFAADSGNCCQFWKLLPILPILLPILETAVDSVVEELILLCCPFCIPAILNNNFFKKHPLQT